MKRLVSHLQARRTTLVSLGSMTGSQMLSAVLALVGGVIQARLVNPDVLGYFSAFAILGTYLGLLHIGWLVPFQREFPYWLGKKDESKAQDAASVVQGWVTLLCAAVGAIYTVLAIISLIGGSVSSAAAWAVQLVVIVTSLYTLYLGCTYRSSSEFSTLAAASVVSSLVSIAALPAVAFLGFWGLCVRALLPALAYAGLLHVKRPVHVPPRLDLRETWRMAKFSLPMDVTGFLATSCMTASLSAVVLAKHGVEALGLIAFARVAEGVVNQFATAFTQVFIPRIGLKMGATENASECARYSVKPTVAAMVATAAIIGGAWVCCGPAVRLLAPKYVEAVPYVRAFLIAGSYPAMLLPKHALIAGKRNVDVAVIFSAAFLFFGAVVVAASFWSLSVMQILLGYVAGRTLSGFVCWGLVWRVSRSTRGPIELDIERAVTVS